MSSPEVSKIFNIYSQVCTNYRYGNYLECILATHIGTLGQLFWILLTCVLYIYAIFFGAFGEVNHEFYKNA